MYVVPLVRAVVVRYNKNPEVAFPAEYVGIPAPFAFPGDTAHVIPVEPVTVPVKVTPAISELVAPPVPATTVMNPSRLFPVTVTVGEVPAPAPAAMVGVFVPPLKLDATAEPGVVTDPENTASPVPPLIVRRVE